MDDQSKMSNDDLRRHQERIAASKGMTVEAYLAACRAGKFAGFNDLPTRSAT